MPQTSSSTDYLPFDPNLAHAIVKAHTTGWAEITHCMVDQTLETLGWPLALGRALAETRSIGQFLDFQAQLSQQTLQAAMDRGRRLSEASICLTREIADCVQNGARQAAETAAQQTATAGEHLASSVEQARAAAANAAKSDGQQSSAQPQGGQADPAQGARAAQGQRPGDRRPPQGTQPNAAH